jgi:hypothetical protein
MRRAFLNPLLFGFLIISSFIIFGATIVDDMVVRNRIHAIKKTTDTVAVTLAKHYLDTKSTEEAELVAQNILNSRDFTQNLISFMDYEWNLDDEPMNVIVGVSGYEVTTFWYRFLDKTEFAIPRIESKAIMVGENEIYKHSTKSLSPFSINGDDFEVGDVNEYCFDENAIWSFDIKDKFYSLDNHCMCMLRFVFNPDEFDYFNSEYVSMFDDCSIDGNSAMAAFQNELADGSFDYDLDLNFPDAIDEGICLLASSLGNLTAYSAASLNAITSGIKALFGAEGVNGTLELDPMVRLDVAILNENTQIDSFMEMGVHNLSWRGSGNTSSRYLCVEMEVLPIIDRVYLEY